MKLLVYIVHPFKNPFNRRERAPKSKIWKELKHWLELDVGLFGYELDMSKSDVAPFNRGLGAGKVFTDSPLDDGSC